MSEKMSEKLLEIIRELEPYDEIDENSHLIEDGILDSLTLVVLIGEIESVFDVKIPEDKLQPELFASVSQIVELIEGLK